MPFVKLDCGILNSTLWFERECRELFITALLMAEPTELQTPTPQLAVTSLDETGWIVPPGWYGLVPAAGPGIIHRAGVAQDIGVQALIKLGEPEAGSRSREFEGRRMVRIDGGYLILNYIKYRERDYTAAERSKRYRERVASRRVDVTSHRDITQAEAEAEAEAEIRVQKQKKEADPERKRLAHSRKRSDARFDTFWHHYPRKVGKEAARRIWERLAPTDETVDAILKAIRWQSQRPEWTKDQGQFIPHPSTWLHQHRWEDEPVISIGSGISARSQQNLAAAASVVARLKELK